MATTPEDAIRAATQIVIDGDKPSVDKIRARLGGGGQIPLHKGLQAWWESLRDRLARPEIPEPLWDSVYQIWREALNQANETFQEERIRSNDEVHGSRVKLEQAQIDLNEAQQEVKHLSNQLIDLMSQHDALKKAFESKSASHDALHEQLSNSQQSLIETKDSLGKEIHKLAAVTTERNAAIQSNEQLQTSIRVIQTELKNEKDNHHESMNQLEQANKLADNEQSRLMLEIDDLRSGVEQATKKTGNLTRENGALSLEIDKKNQALALQIEQNEQLNDEKAGLETRLGQKIASLEAIADERFAERNELKTEIIAIKSLQLASQKTYHDQIDALTTALEHIKAPSKKTSKKSVK